MIHVIRGQRVILDRDLARLYGVETKNLKRQVKRNALRFPADFMIELTREEYNSLRCQNGTIENGRGEHSKYLPYDKGLKPAELKLAESLVEENKEMIIARWKEYFKK